MTAHWDGIYDNETDILVYTWGLGTGQCKDDVHPHHDPHDHLADESEWTHTGVVFPLKLKGKLFVSENKNWLMTAFDSNWYCQKAW